MISYALNVNSVDVISPRYFHFIFIRLFVASRNSLKSRAVAMQICRKSFCETVKLFNDLQTNSSDSPLFVRHFFFLQINLQFLIYSINLCSGLFGGFFDFRCVMGGFRRRHIHFLEKYK